MCPYNLLIFLFLGCGSYDYSWDCCRKTTQESHRQGTAAGKPAKRVIDKLWTYECFQYLLYLIWFLKRGNAIQSTAFLTCTVIKSRNVLIKILIVRKGVSTPPFQNHPPITRSPPPHFLKSLILPPHWQINYPY